MVNSNEEMKDIMKIVKSLENSGLLLKDVSQTSQNKAQEQKSGFLSMLLGKVGGSLLGNLLAEKRWKTLATRANIPGVAKKLTLVTFVQQ